MFPRALLGEARNRPELGRPGIYLLLGEDEDGFPELYIGEADDVGKRIAQHDQGKDFWTHAVVFTASEDEGLDKAQTRYLEARLIELAKSRGQAKIKNQNQGSLPPLSEMDRADAEQFLENLLLCLPPLGVSFLGPQSPKKKAGAQKFYLSSKGVHAEAELTAEGFVVKKGSQVVREPTKSLPQSCQRLRQRLVEAGILKTAGDYYVSHHHQLQPLSSEEAPPKEPPIGRLKTGPHSKNGWRLPQPNLRKKLRTASTPNRSASIGIRSSAA